MSTTSRSGTSRQVGACLGLACLALVRCAGPSPDPVIASSVGEHLLLARHPEALTELHLAGHNRPSGELNAPNAFIVEGPFTEHARTPKTVTWKTEMPVGGVWLSEHRGKQPNGMNLLRAGKTLQYAKHDAGPNSWWTNGDTLFVRLPPAEQPQGLRVRFPRAAAHSRLLNDATDPRDGKDFALRMQPMGDDHRYGLYLPAPSRAVYSVSLPEGAALRSRVRLLKPGVRQGEHSDGAELSVVVDSPQGVRETTVRVEEAAVAWLDLDLSGLSGPSTITLKTAPGKTATFDYVFLEEPAVVEQARERGRKVVMVFLDTVRADHTSVGGYERPTTPALASFAAGGTVFTDARTVAAWTLPSTRSAFTGRQPEHWSESDTLQGVLGTHGFKSGFVATNGFTAAEYEMDRGFSEHILRFLEPADKLTDRAIALLKEHEAEDYFLVVQYMDAHLPYLEPKSHLTRWAAPKPPRHLGENPYRITLNTLRRMPKDDQVYEEARSYLVDRYDQNLRFIDDQLARLFATLHPDDVVVVFSDHGEEFLEHGYWEHGHSLFEEVVRVPMVIRGAGMAAGRVGEPVSLIDMMPTVLDMLDIDHDLSLDGVSLVDVAAGHSEAAEALAERPVTMGRTLYFGDEWAVVHGGRKWIATDGAQSVYDLASDPGEQRPLEVGAEGELWTQRLAEGLGGEVGETWLLVGPGKEKMVRPGAVEVEVTHPDGLTAAWRPAHIFPVKSEPALKDGALKIQVAQGRSTPREVYLLGAEGASPAGMQLTVRAQGQEWTGTVDEHSGNVLLEVGPPTLRYRLVRTPAPLFRQGTLDAYSPLMTEALQELGYLED